MVEGVKKRATKDLKAISDKGRGSWPPTCRVVCKGGQTSRSDVDVAVLLSEAPEKMLEYYLHLVDELSKTLGNDVDLITLNRAPPLLKH